VRRRLPRFGSPDLQGRGSLELRRGPAKGLLGEEWLELDSEGFSDALGTRSVIGDSGLGRF